MRRTATLFPPTLALVALTAVLALTAGGERGQAAGNTTTSPDSGGQYTSIALDGDGFPVISHYAPAGGDLKTVHCGDAACSGGNTLASPDTANNVGQHTSLELDASGKPVVSYFDASLLNVKVLRCGDTACTSANTITSPDASMSNSTGLYSSLALNGGNPVVSYFQVPNDGLRVLRCNDATCGSWGATFADVGSGNIVGLYTSIALDSSGFPVVSYYDETNSDLKVIHCGDATCSSGNTITSPDIGNTVGQYTSLVLDADGHPVVSYYYQTGGDLKVLHCGDATCSSGNTVRSPDTAGDVGKYSSLRLDASGNPVVSHYDASGGNLRVLRCGDTTCTNGNVTMTPDSAGNVGQHTSLALDGNGYPVVSYYDATNGMLKLLHCGDSFCSAAPPPTPTPTQAAVGGVTALPDVAQPDGGGQTVVWLGLLAIPLGAAAIAWRRRARA